MIGSGEWSHPERWRDKEWFNSLSEGRSCMKNQSESYYLPFSHQIGSRSDLALIELISPAAPSQNWLRLKSFPCLRKNIGHFLLAPGLLLRAISNFLSVSPRGSLEEGEDGASARDYSYLDDGPAVPPGSWLVGGRRRVEGELKLHSISANTETLRVCLKRGR